MSWPAKTKTQALPISATQDREVHGLYTILRRAPSGVRHALPQILPQFLRARLRVGS